MTVDQERICYVSGNDRELVHIHVINVVNKLDTTSLRSISWLHNPNVLLGVMLLELLIMLVKFTKFIWQDVGVWNKVKMLLAKPLLHSYYIKTQSVLSGDFVAHREMINLLVLIKALIEITLTTRGGPQNVPFVRLGRSEVRCLQNRSNEFVIEPKHFV